MMTVTLQLKVSSTKVYLMQITCNLSSGPKEDTVCDFWRMIWEKRIKAIIMLTNCVEDSMVRE